MSNRNLINIFKSYLTSIKKPFNYDKESDLEHIDKIYRKYLAGYEGDKWEVFRRAHAQYVYQNNNILLFSQVILRNILGFISIPLIISKILVNSIQLKLIKKIEKNKIDGIKLSNLPEYETPLELCSSNIIHIEEKNYYLPIKEIFYLIYGLLRVGCWYPDVISKMIRHVSLVSHALLRYSPDFFLLFDEYSCTNSIMTQYLNRKGILSINVMHGDKAYGGAGAFFTFNKFYIWHEWYQHYSQSVHAKIDNYIVYRPKRFMIARTEPSNQFSIGIILPAFKIESYESCLLIDCIKNLSNNYIVYVRPHPRYSVPYDIKPIYKAKLSNSQSESFPDFLKNVSLLVGYVSTTLIEAYESGRQVICIRDGRCDSLKAYHPYFRPDIIPIVELNNLLSVVENYLPRDQIV